MELHQHQADPLPQMVRSMDFLQMRFQKLLEFLEKAGGEKADLEADGKHDRRL